MKKFDLSLYLVTDSEGLTEDVFLNKVEQALRSGVTMVQLREKNRTSCEYFMLAQKMRNLTDEYEIPLIIDDRVDIALACAADGVHLGADDLPVDAARRIIGVDKIIGATAKTVEAALYAQQLGADYLGVGAIYPTTTKVKTVLTKVETVKDICAQVDIPVAAIGGLNIDNLAVLRGSGVKGVCVVSALMKSEDVARTAQNLSHCIEQILAD